MTVLKLSGVFLILGAGIFAAVAITKYEKRKAAVLAGWADLIWYIRSQVDCYLLPLPEILLRADSNLLESCSCKQPQPDLAAVFRASQFYLDQESRRLLAAFVRESGYGSREELLRRCDYYITSLGRLREKQLAELPSKTRIASAVCIGAAIFISILLW